jgi:toxin secretion/phage lysis holin
MFPEQFHDNIKDLVSRMDPENAHPLHWLTVNAGQYVAAFPFVGILVLLMILDVLTGIIAASINREIDSNFSFKGALKKAQMLLMVAAGLVFELLYPDVPWGRLIAGLLCLGEMISIVENAGKAGLPIPVQLKETLKRLRTAEKDESTKVTLDIHTEKVVDPPAAGPPVPLDTSRRDPGHADSGNRP